MFEDAYKEIKKNLIAQGIDVNSLEGSFVERLVQHGMFENQALDVINRYKQTIPDLNIRWNEPKDMTPSFMLVIMWIAIKQTALVYIDETCPMAWFRPMFDDKQMEEIEKEQAK